jgi:asparaginyl-tRNA synthetase
MRSLIKHVLKTESPGVGVTVKGWVRTRRDSKGFSFLELNDGSCLANLQVIVDTGTPGSEHLPELVTGASVSVEGELVASPAKGQKWELRAARLELIGKADPSYPLQKKGHTAEFLRTIAHLRPRSNL